MHSLMDLLPPSFTPSLIQAEVLPLLRYRKKLEEMVARQEKMEHNVRGTVANIEQAMTNQQVFRAMQLGTGRSIGVVLVGRLQCFFFFFLHWVWLLWDSYVAFVLVWWVGRIFCIY